MKRGHDEKISYKLSRAPKRRQGEEELSDSVYLTFDLMVNILSKLPMRSLSRFRCVSKQWSSTLIAESIKTRSLIQPRLLVISNDSWGCKSSFSSYTYPQNTKTTTFLSEERLSRRDNKLNFCSRYRYVRGLVCCCSSLNNLVIYNPTTIQYFLLPHPNNYEFSEDEDDDEDDVLFGYDPVENLYKVLFISGWNNIWRVFTFGVSKKRECWRNIRHQDNHTQCVTSVCINGIIYYMEGGSRGVLKRFHVRTERFDSIVMPETLKTEKEFTFVNYQGKLGCIREDSGEMWIMEDGNKKQEWSKIILSMSLDLCASLESRILVIAGVTSDGEIAIMPKSLDLACRLYAYFHDPKRNKTRRVEFETSMRRQLEHRRIGVHLFTAPDHVENTMSLSTMIQDNGHCLNQRSNQRTNFFGGIGKFLYFSSDR